MGTDCLRIEGQEVGAGRQGQRERARQDLGSDVASQVLPERFVLAFVRVSVAGGLAQ